MVRPIAITIRESDLRDAQAYRGEVLQVIHHEGKVAYPASHRP